MSRPCVAIFRKRLLSYSETFIADQGQLLPRYQPLYTGYSKDCTGIHLIDNSQHRLLQDFSSNTGIAKLRLQLGFSTNNAWLSAIKQANPLLIHGHFLSDAIDATLLGRLLSLPVVATVHGHDITKQEKTSFLRKDRRFFFEHVDRVIAVSKFIAEQALASGCPEHKLVQHYIGIDLEKFTQVKNESDQPSILFVGRLVEKKGCTYLLQALEKLGPRFPNLRLTIVGEGILKSSLQQEAQSRQLNVDFVGTETAQQIRDRLAHSWLFVAPSITAEDGDAEGLGMVFLEAQALNTPVISFRSGGVVEAVEHASTGLLCAEKDVEGLVENITILLENSSLRYNLGKEGRKRVESQFDIRKQCLKLEQIYDDVSNRARSNLPS